MKTRVLVIHDSAYVRRTVSKALETMPSISAASSAPGSDMLSYLIRQYKPHFILRVDATLTAEEKKLFDVPAHPGILSLLPPDANELSDKTTAAIVQHVCRKIGIAAATDTHASTIPKNHGTFFSTHEASALTPVNHLRHPEARGITVQKSELIRGSDILHTTLEGREKKLPLNQRKHFNKIVFCGASTGGTEALKTFLSDFPANSPTILITQHMPEGFTRSFAERLNKACAMEIVEAVDRDPIRPGCAYIAPGHSHLYIERIGGTLYTRLSQDPPVNRHRPSVEVLFLSAAKVVGRQAVGVMFTGMGKDGALAMLKMREAGAYNIAQDEATSIVYGMPREAAFVGAVHEILPLPQIAHRVYEIASK